MYMLIRPMTWQGYILNALLVFWFILNNHSIIQLHENRSYWHFCNSICMYDPCRKNRQAPPVTMQNNGILNGTELCKHHSSLYLTISAQVDVA